MLCKCLVDAGARLHALRTLAPRSLDFDGHRRGHADALAQLRDICAIGRRKAARELAAQFAMTPRQRQAQGFRQRQGHQQFQCVVTP